VFYIALSYITLSYYLVYASLLSLLQLFFCLHVRLLYAIKYYLLTYLLMTRERFKEKTRLHARNADLERSLLQSLPYPIVLLISCES